eukprot:GHVU01054184.1.p2 GENE.GHVU01054184.1~~GHVU01054184.1.p2  ORF type:complete len:113 (-),score=16.63 GHVU01054184.1:1757-2095(-)
MILLGPPQDLNQIETKATAFEELVNKTAAEIIKAFIKTLDTIDNHIDKSIQAADKHKAALIAWLDDKAGATLPDVGTVMIDTERQRINDQLVPYSDVIAGNEGARDDASTAV